MSPEKRAAVLLFLFSTVMHAAAVGSLFFYFVKNETWHYFMMYIAMWINGGAAVLSGFMAVAVAHKFGERCTAQTKSYIEYAQSMYVVSVLIGAAVFILLLLLNFNYGTHASLPAPVPEAIAAGCFFFLFDAAAIALTLAWG